MKVLHCAQVLALAHLKYKFLLCCNRNGAQELKEHKKKKPSFLEKMGSYRQKKVRIQSLPSFLATSLRDVTSDVINVSCVQVSKERPSSASSHRFVSISVSNATPCDVCGRTMVNKCCVQCESE